MYSNAYYARQRAAASTGGASALWSKRTALIVALWCALVFVLYHMPSSGRRSMVRSGKLVFGDLNRRLGLGDDRHSGGDAPGEGGVGATESTMLGLGGSEDEEAGGADEEEEGEGEGDSPVEGEDEAAARARRRRLRRRRRAAARRRRRRAAREAAAAGGEPVSVDGAAGEGSIELLKPGELPAGDAWSTSPKGEIGADWEALREGEAAARRRAVEEDVQSAMEQQQQAQGQQEELREEDGHDHGHGHSHGAPAPPQRDVTQPPVGVAPPGANDALPLDANGWPVYDAAPPRPAGWVAQQRPRPGTNERALSSHKLEEAGVRSINPPLPRDALPPRVRAELGSRLVIGLGQGVHSGRLNLQEEGLGALAIMTVMLKSFLPTAQAHHVYRWYFAFDHNDRVFEDEENRRALTAMILKAVDEEDARRWHPPGYSRPPSVSPDGQILIENPEVLAVDNSALVVSVHWVHCNYHSKPSWAHSDAILAAYREGADYAYRGNDDSKLPETRMDWVDAFIEDLRGRSPPNVGLVGPSCEQGAKWILTHDFTHRTHAVIFGWHYPRSLPDWSSDDWITLVYKSFTPPLMSRREDIPVVHELHGTRYNPSSKQVRLAALNSELHAGTAVIAEWAKATYGVQLTYSVTPVECC